MPLSFIRIGHFCKPSKKDSFFFSVFYMKCIQSCCTCGFMGTFWCLWFISRLTAELKIGLWVNLWHILYPQVSWWDHEGFSHWKYRTDRLTYTHICLHACRVSSFALCKSSFAKLCKKESCDSVRASRFQVCKISSETPISGTQLVEYMVSVTRVGIDKSEKAESGSEWWNH